MTGSARLELILWATDVPALASFLEQVAGLAITEQHPGFAILETGGTSLAIHADEAYRGHPWHEALHREGAARGIGAELRFQVEDLQAAYRTGLRIGGSVVYPPHAQDDIWECQLLAPDGYLVTLWSNVSAR